MSSSSASTSPEPPTKRKRAIANDTSDDSDSDSGSESDFHQEAEEVDDEEPPLSHAEKRRQKKKEKLAATKEKEAGEPSKKKRKLADGKAKASDSDKKHPTRQNSVWVGNLSYKTTSDALRAFFDGVGEITRINMPMKPSGRPGIPGENRGFAYVDFSSSDAKTIAITLSERPLNGRKLLIKDGDSFEGRPKPAGAAEQASNGANDEAHISISTKSLSKTGQKILNQQKKPPAPTLFLGNLPFETTEDSIREMLDAHRPKPKKDDSELKKEEDSGKEDWIRRIRLGTFEDSGLCKGFAFVDFTSIEHATSALVNPRNHNFNGRKLVVEYASAEAVRRGPNRPKVERNDTEGKGKVARDRKHERTGKPGFRKSGTGSDESKRDEATGYDHIDGDEGGRKVEESGAKRIGRDSAPGLKQNRSGGGNNNKGPRGRPKPGAALAQAIRQSAAIVTSSDAASKKIVFD